MASNKKNCPLGGDGTQDCTGCTLCSKGKTKNKVKPINPVVKILMNRDGITREEAEAQLAECRAELDECFNGTSCLDPEEVIASELGLEPDYIFDIIGW